MAVFSLLSDADKAELWSCLALKHSRGLGLHSANALIEHYGSAFEAVELGRRAPGCWVSEGLVSERTARAFAGESWREKARQEWEALQNPQRQFLFRTHHRYPALLAEIHDAPLVLYYDGDIRLLANPMIGVVGSRRCSDAGLLACAVLTRQLASFGVTIVSGLAKGIDRAAHIAGLSALGSSVAVLGTGIDVLYPESNEDVFAILQERGLILSEFLPGTGPHAKNFPIRNRIISGLSRGVLIVEAAKRSGSLITARLALEQGRDVFAIPGSSVGKHSEGCHELIRNGAKPVFSAEDIVLDLAPLLTIDIKDQLTRLHTEERPSSIAQFSKVLHEKVSLPPLVKPLQRPQETGYTYGRKDSGERQASPLAKSVLPAPQTAFLADGGWPRATVPETYQMTDRQFGQNARQRIGESTGQNIGQNVGQDPGQNPGQDSGQNSEQNSEQNTKKNIGKSLGQNTRQNTRQGKRQSTGQEACQKARSGALQGACEGLGSGQGCLSIDEAPSSGTLEERLVALLRGDWRHIDWLSESLGEDTASVSTALTLLEVGGVVVQKPGMYYRLASE